MRVLVGKEWLWLDVGESTPLVQMAIFPIGLPFGIGIHLMLIVVGVSYFKTFPNIFTK